MDFTLNNGNISLCCKGCGRQDKQLNTYDWLADIPGNAEETELVEVQFKNTRKGYYRNSNHLPLEKGDIVAVELSRRLPVWNACAIHGNGDNGRQAPCAVPTDAGTALSGMLDGKEIFSINIR